MKNEKGSVSVLVAISLVALCGIAAFAVDYGYLHAKKSQLQSAADLACLAGASSLLGSGEDLDEVKAVALEYGQRNLRDDDNPNVALTVADVVFYKNNQVVAEDPDSVEVTVRRVSDRGNPVDLFLAPVLGRETSDVSATARASLFCASGSSCLKPFSPPAKFTWNDTCEPKRSPYYNNGSYDLDSECESDSVQTLGYDDSDVGTSLVIKEGAGGGLAHGNFYAVTYPPDGKEGELQQDRGANDYEDNIKGCDGSNSVPVEVGDVLTTEPGNMSGKTWSGIQYLIEQDPNATWNSAESKIEGSAFEDPMDSPRVVLIPFHDVSTWTKSGRAKFTVYQLGAVFIENVQGHGNKSIVNAVLIRANAKNPERSNGQCDADDFGLYGTSLTLDSTRQ